jgi:hypothetical protein
LWDYRAKKGFYLGPALDHYRCYKLVKLETKQNVISNTVEFRHTYLQIPVVLADNKIINGPQVMAGALQNTPPPTSSNQLDAIEMLSTLFEKWKCLAPKKWHEGVQCASCVLHHTHHFAASPIQLQLRIVPTTLLCPRK